METVKADDEAKLGIYNMFFVIKLDFVDSSIHDRI